MPANESVSEPQKPSSSEILIPLSDVSLASMTSWRIGGNAKQLVRPTSSEQLIHYFQNNVIPKHQVWLGLGSNVLIPDEGVHGLVVCTRAMQQCTILPNGWVYADAGLTCAKFSRFCSRNGFPDGAFFAGIPGTIGGALAMNAGAFGGETWEWVQKTKVLMQAGNMIERNAAEYTVGYRSVSLRSNYLNGVPEAAGHFNQEAFLGAYFKFPKKLSEDGLLKIKELLRKRADTQPIGTLNCGSVYRNPEGDFAAKLIEGCQLKGFTIGDALVSTKHANFIINQGSGTAKDIQLIMSEIEDKVYARYQVRLEPEVRIIEANYPQSKGDKK
tara:strand:+ start:58750 stop:59733 length:984 start_codon:yes stop_codon:yes gene_type:complete